MEKFVKSR